MIYLWGMIKQFVVYQHRRKDTGKIFYIGIGDKDRPYDKKGRNKLWKDIVNKTDYDVEILYVVNNRIQACVIEIMLIEKYGRINLDLNGILTNRTKGGEGTNGLIHSEKSKKKMSEIAKKRIGILSPNYGKNFNGEKNPHWGFKHNKITKTKISVSRKGKYSGEEHNKTTLTKEDVIWIRNYYEKSKKTKKIRIDISKKFNISESSVQKIIYRKTWKHI